jgi:hypothetical protein
MGAFIMMGAHTGSVVQRLVADRTASILVALPLAFAAGGAMERRVIRRLYKPPAGNAPRHLPGLDRTAAVGKEPLRHPGPPPDRARPLTGPAPDRAHLA